jgi:hypothetical protein
MKNVRYRKFVGPRPEPGSKLSLELYSLEAPEIVLTEEVNGFAIFHINERGDVALVEWINGDRNDAIERAVELAIERGRPTKIEAAK